MYAPQKISDPFLFGAQYYRAPTPEPECWETDLRRMRELGFNHVKFWVQWRWSHRAPDRFVFDDIDRLMDLAHKNGLKVTLNIILDVAPVWLYEKYPDARPVLNDGSVVEPKAYMYRQIGGFPGPCYNHPGALAERKKFFAETIRHFKGHPALEMWDVWNEPEQISEPYRIPIMEKLPCYCPHCKEQFITWLQAKYHAIEKLNRCWGRNYEQWADVEIPRTAHLYLDFIDWRESRLDMMTREAEWRLALAREHDGEHITYLHVVCNTLRIFNSVTGVDDGALAEKCDCFGSTILNGPIWPTMLTSAAPGKITINAESHIAGGDTALHSKHISLQDLLDNFIPQIGMGVRGFLFWQYRPEILGREAPAWGVVNLDGSDKDLTRAVRIFKEKLGPYMDDLAVPAEPAEVAILNSRTNELFHFGMHDTLNRYADSIEGYIDALYDLSIPARTLSSSRLTKGSLEGVKVLLLPDFYYATGEEIESIDQYLRNGGVVLCEAHIAAYNGDTGRHERQLPGGGLVSRWGIEEKEVTAACYLKRGETEEGTSLPQNCFLIRLHDGTNLVGYSRYAELSGPDLETIGVFEKDKPLIVKKNVGNGTLFYCGTNAGEGSRHDSTGLKTLLRQICSDAGVRAVAEHSTPLAEQPVHIDAIHGKKNSYLTVIKKSEDAEEVTLTCPGNYRGIFSGMHLETSDQGTVVLAQKITDIFIKLSSS